METRLILLAVLLVAAALPSWTQQDDLVRLYQEAQKAQSAGDLATATLKYQAIVKIRPDLAEAFANLGNLYYQQGKPELAAPAYKKAIELKPALTGPYFFLGMMAFNARSYPEALRYLKQAAVLEPRNAMVLSYLGYTYYAETSYEDATRQLEQAAALDGTDQDVFYHLSKSYGHLAENSFAELKKRFPDSLYTNLARAHYYETEQDWKNAAEHYAAALEKKPDSARLQMKAARAAALAAGKPAPPLDGPPDELIDGSLVYLYSPPQGEAIKVEFAARQRRVQAIREKAVATPEHYYLTGDAYQVLSYLASLWVIGMDPTSYRAHQLQAQLLESSGKEDEAVREYSEVVRLQPDITNVHFAIGNLHWKNLRFAEAKVELLRELELSPHHPQAFYELGDIALTSGNVKEAEQYYLKALKYEPNMIEAHYALEKIYTESGQYDKSLEHLRAAMKVDDSDPTPHYRLAQVFRKLGKSDEAESELEIFQARRAKTKKKE